MTKPRTLEEIADEMPCTCPGEHHEPLVYVNCARVRCLAALREAAEQARREEREALREWVDRRRNHHGSDAVVFAEAVLVWLDARSRPEEPRPGGLNSPTG